MLFPCSSVVRTLSFSGVEGPPPLWLPGCFKGFPVPKMRWGRPIVFPPGIATISPSPESPVRSSGRARREFTGRYHKCRETANKLHVIWEISFLTLTKVTSAPKGKTVPIDEYRPLGLKIGIPRHSIPPFNRVVFSLGPPFCPS